MAGAVVSTKQLRFPPFRLQFDFAGNVGLVAQYLDLSNRHFAFIKLNDDLLWKVNKPATHTTTVSDCECFRCGDMASARWSYDALIQPLV